ncbi:MAG: hypothetical protein JNK38_04590 [Acidobacteria bacterium]|nr:hypothetical protein [Acidobacteriota bacterium]
MSNTTSILPTSEDSSSARGFLKWGGLLAIAYLTIAFFPSGGALIFPYGLDNSWQFALSHLPQSDYSLGKDVFFTYGPLGYLLYPLPVGNALWQAVIFRLTAHLLLGVLLFLHWRAIPNRSGFFSFIVCFLLLNLLTYQSKFTLLEVFPDYYLLMICGLAFSLGLKRENLLASGLAICAVISGLMLFAKFNTGVAAASFFWMALGTLFFQQAKWRKVLLFAAALYAGTVLISSFVFIGGPRQIAMWLKTSLEIASGFSVAMSILGERFDLLECLTVFAIFLSLTAWQLVKRRNAGLVGLAFLPAMFLAFKSGFVRQDSHELMYFFAANLTICVIILSIESWREIAIAAPALLLAFAITAEVRSRFWENNNLTSQIVSFINLNSGLTKIRQLINFSTLEQQVIEESRNNLKVLKLAESWLNGIDRQHDSFSVLPWEINFCPANDLKWNPLPTLQAYAAYTSWLDDLNSAHFNNPYSPDFLLVTYETIDSRHLLWDTPSTWRTVLNNYQIEKTAQANSPLLLKRKPQLTTPDWQTIGETATAPHQWTEIPESSGLLYAQMNLSWSLSGQVRKFAFRVPPVMLELENASGQIVKFRIMPDVARNGLLMNFPPNDFDSLTRLFDCQAKNPVRRFRITGRGADFLNPAIKLTWKKAITPCGRITQPTN